MDTNVLYCGDNLEVMPRFIEPESIDLIYIDPPFFSSRYYEVIFGDIQEKRAFEDRWKGELYHYVNWLSARIAKMRELLKPTGSIYVHLDWHAVHYMKVELDRIFGYDNFLNEIIWHYRRWPAPASQFQRMHDVILCYSRTHGENSFNVLLQPLTEGTLKRWRGRKSRVEFKDGVRQVTKMTDELSSGTPTDDVWDIPVINSQARERLGYPTQKPEALLQRIIKASSNQGDVVADFFCGCGTALAVAHQLGRRWIGCDVSPTALRVVRERLQRLGATDIKMVNYPMSEPELRAMRPFEFQNYVISFIQGIHSPKLSGDFGIDGYTLFNRLPIQVKQQDHVGRPDVQKFESAIRKERKEKGYIFGLGFTKPAYDEAARIKMESNIEIILHTVQDLVSSDKSPDIL